MQDCPLGEDRLRKERQEPENRGGKGPFDNLPRAMTIQVSGKNLDVGEALRSYVQERVVHTVEKFIGREPTGHARIEINGGLPA